MYHTLARRMSWTKFKSTLFTEHKGRVSFMGIASPSSNANETWTGGIGTMKTASRNAAFCNILADANDDGVPRVLVIDSAESVSTFHLALRFDKVDIVPVSSGATWKDIRKSNLSLTSFSTTRDAYTYHNNAFDGVFLDACGCAPRLIGDLGGIEPDSNQDDGCYNIDGYCGAFESINKKGGVFGITWCNSRKYCTRENLLKIYDEDSRVMKIIDRAGGAFVQIDEDDEARHFEWMMNLMAFCAHLENFRLELHYSTYIPRGVMRTVIFKVIPSVSNVANSIVNVLDKSPVQHILDFWKRIDSFLVNDNYQVLLTDYLRNVVADTKNVLKTENIRCFPKNTVQELEALESFVEDNISSRSKPAFKPAYKPKKRERECERECEPKPEKKKSSKSATKKLRYDDYIVVTKSPGYESKLHNGTKKCHAITRLNARTNGPLKYEVPEHPENFDRCSVCYK